MQSVLVTTAITDLFLGSYHEQIIYDEKRGFKKNGSFNLKLFILSNKFCSWRFLKNVYILYIFEYFNVV